MQWNVYTYNVNAKQVEKYNIFNHGRFLEECKIARKKFNDDKEKYIDHIKRALMWSFWSKCEWEIIISDWPPHPDYPDLKVDVYDQVMLNWDIFSDYVWEHRSELRKV